MPWLQLFVDANREHIDAVESALINAGAVSVTLQEHLLQGQQEHPILEPALGEMPLWQDTRITGLFHAHCNTQQINWLIQESLSPVPTLRWEQLEDKDWEREWMENYHPIQCAESLWICPSWKSPPDPAATNLLLDPGLAFGTGTHPTTFLCMQWLAHQELEQKTGIDYGCGSGILGICALLLGAQHITGIDIDPQALTATHENVKRNNITIDRFPVFLPQTTAIEPADIEPADIVIANILAGPLIELADTLLQHLKIGGKICLSGILKSQEDMVKNAYNHAIDFSPTQQKEDWIQLSGQRKH